MEIIYLQISLVTWAIVMTEAGFLHSNEPSSSELHPD